ncbi:MAG: hypothetical protein GXN93_01135 [Candidatus Diapherotrites archaeon]|jgi:hypothetical protein|nr:hypothetical protein [Candidatus Diapherotrites archaeon]
MRGTSPWLIALVVIFIGFAVFMTLVTYGILEKRAGQAAAQQCVLLCNAAKKAGVSMQNGPCLSDLYSPEWNIPDWVCDVAHNPRQPVDNIPQNQCKPFLEGKAHHFVEVDENCHVIRIV